MENGVRLGVDICLFSNIESSDLDFSMIALVGQGIRQLTCSLT